MTWFKNTVGIVGTIAGLALFAVGCGSSGSASLDPATFPTQAGSTQNGAVDIDGTTVEYVVTLPQSFSEGSTAPVLLAFPPGGQDLTLTRNTVDAVYAAQALNLGWVVVSPAAPDGNLFFNGGEEVLPGFVDWIEAWVTPEGGGMHVAGISNGGRSTFRYAAQNPDRVKSIVAFPGFAGDEDLDALEQLSDVPIRIYVGGNDTPWIEGAETTVAKSNEFGGDINLEIIAGEDHIIQATSDGRIVFGLLESFR